MNAADSPSFDDVCQAIVDHVLSHFVSSYDRETLPRDQSLVELGVIDSYGVVELVAFLEDTWSVTVADEEITREKMGSIDKMAALVVGKKRRGS